jgi:hypothetical protein
MNIRIELLPELKIHNLRNRYEFILFTPIIISTLCNNKQNIDMCDVTTITIINSEIINGYEKKYIFFIPTYVFNILTSEKNSNCNAEKF